MKALHLIFIIMLLYPHTSFAQQSSCDYKVEILVDKEEFEKEEFTWRMKATKLEGKSTNITGTAEIQDSSGRIAKTYKPWTSDSISKQKTSSEYSPNLKEGKEYEISAKIDVDCDDTNNGNNIDSKKIKIRGVESEDKAKEGKSENAKPALKKQSIDYKETAQNKISNEEINAVKPKLKKSAADEEADNIIQLANKKEQKKGLQQSTAYAAQKQEIIYESGNEKAKALIMLFLLALSVLLNIVLIWKR